MMTIDELVAEINETALARLARPHDEARMRYRLHTVTVPDFRAFEDVLLDYYRHHRNYTGHYCSDPRKALSEVKQLLERVYREQGGLTGAYQDGRRGTNGGMRGVLDQIAYALRFQDTQLYLTDIFDRYVHPLDWEPKVAIMTQFLQRYGHLLGDSVDPDCPERYAHNYRELIQKYVEGLNRAGAQFRRM